MSRGGSNFSYVCLLLFPVSLGRAGARKTRRWIRLLAVGWFPPSVSPSGACRTRGPSVPCGLLTPPRGPPHRGGASAERRKHAGELWLPPAAVFLPEGSQPRAWPWPPARPAMPGPWRPRPEGHGCLWPSGGDPVCRAGPARARGSPGARRGALPGAVGGGDCPWPETGTPRRLRRGHAAQASAQAWSCHPGDDVPHAPMPRG